MEKMNLWVKFEFRGAYVSEKGSVNIRKVGHKRNQGLKDAKLYVNSLRHGVRHSIDD